jgi:hypothetical protein
MGEESVLADSGWAGEKSGLSEQPAGHSASVSDFRLGVVAGIFI